MWRHFHALNVTNLWCSINKRLEITIITFYGVTPPHKSPIAVVGTRKFETIIVLKVRSACYYGMPCFVLYQAATLQWTDMFILGEERWVQRLWWTDFKHSQTYPRLVTPNNRKHTQWGTDQAVEWRPGIYKTWVTDTSQAIAASHWPHWLLSGYATSICFFLWVVSDKCWTVCLLAAEKRNKKWGRSRKNKEHLPVAWFSSLRLAINTSCVPLEGTQFFLIIRFFPIIMYLSEKLCTEVFSSRCTMKMSVKLHVCIEIVCKPPGFLQSPFPFGLFSVFVETDKQCSLDWIQWWRWCPEVFVFCLSPPTNYHFNNPFVNLHWPSNKLETI